MRALIIAIMLLGAVGFGWAQTPMGCPGSFDTELRAIDYGEVVVSSSAVGLTIPDGTILAIASVEDAEVRYLDTGDTPTTTAGRPAPAASELLICRQSLRPVRFIATGGDAVLKVVFYGR